MATTVSVDCIIFGGGITGLWTLHRLRQRGFHAILLEKEALGSEQTIHSQGIIHRGLKYALQGFLTPAAKEAFLASHIWEECLKGSGEIDLSQVRELHPHQYLWSLDGFSSKLATFLASKAMQSYCHRVTTKELPTFFRYQASQSAVYCLKEKVLDVSDLLEKLAVPYRNWIYSLSNGQYRLHHDGRKIQEVTIETETTSVTLQAKAYIMTAGKANLSLLEGMEGLPSMQLRPLRMTCLETPDCIPFYGHAIQGLQNTPQLTITTHLKRKKQSVWYIGGQVAEEGAKKEEDEHLYALEKQWKTLFPWFPLQKAKWSSFLVDRAEKKQFATTRPRTAYVKHWNNVWISWPTKLIYAPLVARRILSQLPKEWASQRDEQIEALSSPAIAKPYWQRYALCHSS